jgi:hypothetical protein
MKRFLLLAALVAAPAFAAEFEGVTSPDTVTVDGKTLKLNGMGLRTKFVFKVYVASLYLENTATTGPEIIKADGVRRVELKMLRDLEKKAIVDAIKEGFEKNNSAAALVPLQDRLSKFNEKVGDVKKGATLVIQYVPGKGTTIEGGKDSYVAEGKDFADALFSVWIGAKPVDDNLKKGMLGGK